MDELITSLMIFVGIVVVGVIYFFPTYLAFRKNHRNAVAIAAVNLLLGWMFVGWVGALIWALTKE